jgi:hypothetical protein
MTWCIPITLVEYGREALIEADTKTEALQKLRACDWEELSDCKRWKVTKVGACVKVEGR